MYAGYSVVCMGLCQFIRPGKSCTLGGLVVQIDFKKYLCESARVADRGDQRH